MFRARSKQSQLDSIKRPGDNVFDDVAQKGDVAVLYVAIVSLSYGEGT